MKEIATFAAGCFWGVESVFQNLPGILKTEVGYIGGHIENPTYEDVCTDESGHAEAVQIEYDPQQVTYSQLLEIFWKNHNPTTLNRQGPDEGTQYRSAIFYHSESQKQDAEKSKQDKASRFPRPIVTEIVPATKFYPAEEYHQKYLKKRGLDHCHT